MLDCKNWRDCGVKGGGCCTVWHTNPAHPICTVPQPTYDICNKCEIREPNGSKGLGDTVKKMIDKVTRGKVKPCGGCKKRQERLNKILPYKGDNDGR